MTRAKREMELSQLLDGQRKGQRHADAEPKLVIIKIRKEEAGVPKDIKKTVSDTVAAALKVKKLRVIVTEIKAGNDGDSLDIIVIIMPGSGSAVKATSLTSWSEDEPDDTAEELANALVALVQKGALPQFLAAHVYEQPPRRVFEAWRELIAELKTTELVCQRYLTHLHKRQLNLSFRSWQDDILKTHRHEMLVRRFIERNRKRSLHASFDA